ncbi:hypothetical protein [Methanocella sp. MCL-LM]|uniref:hypothetical protein n=1 Tax=Methanocella sp. MCL-LM TaxID=3412035 RepID=UPI003C72FC2D
MSVTEVGEEVWECGKVWEDNGVLFCTFRMSARTIYTKYTRYTKYAKYDKRADCKPILKYDFGYFEYFEYFV